MINALEKVVYPNGKTQSLAEIGGAAQGLSALIDEVDKNTSAITSITSQLSALVEDVSNNTSAINTIKQAWTQILSELNPLYNSSDGDLADIGSDNIPKSVFEGNWIKISFKIMSSEPGNTTVYGYKDEIVDGDHIAAEYTNQDGNEMYLSSISIFNRPSVGVVAVRYYAAIHFDYDNKGFRGNFWQSATTPIQCAVTISKKAKL